MPSASANAKRLALLCHPTLGGSSVVACELAACMQRRGWEVTLFAHERPARLHKDVPFVRTQAPSYPLFESPPHDLALCSALVAEHERAPFDIVHAHYAIPHAALALFARSMMRAPLPAIVTTLHGTDVTLVGAQASFHPLVRWTLEQVDAVTAVSAHLMAATRARFGVERELHVIPNWVEVASTPTTRESGPPRLVHVSNFRALKNAPLVVDVFAALCVKPGVPQDLELWMVGAGPDLAEAERRAALHNITARVRWIGATAEPARYVAGAHAFVLPSGAEAFGLAALEAMALGVVPVASAIGGLPEVIEDGVSGFLIPVAEDAFNGPKEAFQAPPIEIAGFVSRLYELCVDDGARERMGRAARERAATKFTPSVMMDQYESVYRAALEQRRRSENHGTCVSRP
jgi:L-malate glycosyltransferase